MRTALPDFLAAARWAMYAERLMPHLDRAHEVQGIEVSRDMDPASRGRIGKAKMQAGRLIPALRGVLFPEDDDV